ncbi:MAG: energy-coupling factor transporter transmembrane protein EcfT [Propionicimonas sp.]
MSQAVMIGLYQPGSTVLHRLGVGPKLFGLAVLSLVIVLVRDWPAAVAGFALATVLAIVAGLHWRTLLRQTRPILVMAVMIAAFQWWISGPQRAIESMLDLISLTILALVVTATTPINAMIDAVVRWCRPLPGVDEDRVALLLALAIRAIPASLELVNQTRDAAVARGLGRHPRAFLSPFVVRVVANAQATGDALAARGLD